MAYLVGALDRDRFEVEALSLFDELDPEMEAALARTGRPVHLLGKRLGPDLRMPGRVDRVIRAFRPHVVHSHRYVLAYALPSIVGRRVPLALHTIHNLAEREAGTVGRRIQALAFRLGVVPVAIAEQVAESLERVYGPGNYPLIPNGVDLERFRSPEVGRAVWRRREGIDPNSVVFVAVGRLDRQKNHALLLEAFAAQAASDPRARLLIAGEGEFGDALESQAVALGIEEHVRFLGRRGDIPDVLAAADVFAASSDWEGNPLAVMEAMAAGLPVVHTAVGGVPELVTGGRDGILCPPGDRDALAAALSRMLHDVALRERLGLAAAEAAAARFSLGAMVHAYERLYAERLGTVRDSDASGELTRRVQPQEEATS